MGLYSIKNLDLLKVLDSKTYSEYYGCDQEWYKNHFKRKAGCGPSVTSNIFFYYARFYEEYKSLIPKEIHNSDDFLELMDEIWEFVTPTAKGVNTTSILAEGGVNFANSKGIDLKVNTLDIPTKLKPRLPISKLKIFLIDALTSNSPIAFLNLSNGKEKNLWNWHWVTIVSAEFFPNGKIITHIVDEGKKKEIDLNLWYKTSKLGGGFVWFQKV